MGLLLSGCLKPPPLSFRDREGVRWKFKPDVCVVYEYAAAVLVYNELLVMRLWSVVAAAEPGDESDLVSWQFQTEVDGLLVFPVNAFACVPLGISH